MIFAQALLKAGSRFDVTDDKGRTELHQACMKNCAPAAVALISHGCDMNLKNQPGNTPLHLAASCNAKGGEFFSSFFLSFFLLLFSSLLSFFLSSSLLFSSFLSSCEKDGVGRGAIVFHLLFFFFFLFVV